MQSLQTAYQKEPQVRPGEWHDALWVQYMNCVNSLRAQSAESMAAQGTQRFESGPSWDAFEGNVIILEAMCEGYGLLDKDYDAILKEMNGDNHRADSNMLFAMLTRLLKQKAVWKERRAYLGRI